MEHTVVALFLLFFTLELAVEIALNELNLRHVKSASSPETLPEIFRARMTQEDYQKSVQYTLAKGRFDRWSEIYGASVTLFLLFSGILPFLDHTAAKLTVSFSEAWPARGILFCYLVGFLGTLLNAPLDLYSTFIIEEKFGFNKTTLKLYIVDKIKTVMVSLLIGVPFLYVVLRLMASAGPSWWLWAFAFIAAFQFLMVFLYPVLIAPLFNKFEPLPEGELRRRIFELAKQVGFTVARIYTIDGSKRSSHSNAYFTGFGRNKRIVLFDTLMKQMEMDQAIAVLAHEMGHYKMKHIVRMMLIQAIFLFSGLYVLSRLLNYPPLYLAFGFEEPSSHAALVLFSFLIPPFIFYLTPALNFLSRRHEYEADSFAARTLKDTKAMQESLVRLTVTNLSNLNPHPLYSAYHYSHPTTTERLAALNRLEPTVAG